MLSCEVIKHGTHDNQEYQKKFFHSPKTLVTSFYCVMLQIQGSAFCGLSSHILSRGHLLRLSMHYPFYIRSNWSNHSARFCSLNRILQTQRCHLHRALQPNHVTIPFSYCSFLPSHQGGIYSQSDCGHIILNGIVLTYHSIHLVKRV